MVKNGINVLSLFDGMSCGQIALSKLNIKVNNYFASEIDKSAINVTQDNFPDTIQIGDITKVKYKNGILYTENGDYNVDNIDLIIGGSPCTNLSIAGNKEGLIYNTLKNYLDLKNSGYKFKGQSYLFWEYYRLIEEIKPNYFLLENVKMAKKWEELITTSLGVDKIEINSELVSSQHRRRLYWANIPNIKQPEDKHIYLSDVVSDGVSDGVKVEFNNDGICVLKANNGKNILLEEKNKPPYTVYEARTEFGKQERRRLRELHGRDMTPRDSKCKEYRYNSKNKINCILTSKNNLDYILDRNYNYRPLSIEELEKGQTIPVGYTSVEKSETKRRKMIGNGWTVDVIVHILKNILISD